MKRLLTIVAASIILMPRAIAGDTDMAGAYIRTIDSLLTKQNDFEMVKLLNINSIKESCDKASTLAERFTLNERLSDEYASYRADSALKYINSNLEIAEKTGNKDWEARTLLNKANLLTGSGMLSESDATLRKIDRQALSDDVLIDYFGEKIYLYSHFGNYAGGSDNRYYAREHAYMDSIMRIITPEHPDYLWYKGWYVLGNKQSNLPVIKALSEKLGNSRYDSRSDAKNAYILSRLYRHEGDTANAMKYMALSAIADIRTANTEIASMRELAEYLFRKNDIDRAYRYINYSLGKAQAFPNRVRIVEHISSLDKINGAYQEKNRQQERRIKIGLFVVCLLALVLFATVAVIINQNGKLKRQRHILDEANHTLNEHVSELSKAKAMLNEANSRLKELNENLRCKNDELNEANYVKEEYIGYVFTLCSDNIRKLDELRKSIHAKAAAGKLKDIERITWGATLMKDELKDFYHSFDTIFLHIYPDFVKDFNALLQDDKAIVPKEGELLNTELRIYALVRLGITDSIKIAEFLHCSPQTVYNNRFRVRNKAKVPKEKFAETVRVLGKFVDKSI